MKLSDQLKLLLELEDRVSALERVIFRSDKDSLLSAKEAPTAEPSGPVSKPNKSGPCLDDLSTEDLAGMSGTELVQIARMKGLKRASRSMTLNELSDLILEGPFCKSDLEDDPTEHIRDSIHHFITKVQPSLKHQLRCSRDCMGICPVAQVVDCWASNKEKIQEAT